MGTYFSEMTGNDWVEITVKHKEPVNLFTSVCYVVVMQYKQKLCYLGSAHLAFLTTEQKIFYLLHVCFLKIWNT